MVPVMSLALELQTRTVGAVATEMQLVKTVFRCVVDVVVNIFKKMLQAHAC